MHEEYWNEEENKNQERIIIISKGKPGWEIIKEIFQEKNKKTRCRLRKS